MAYNDAARSVGLLWTSDQLYWKTHNTHNKQISMPPWGIRTRNPRKWAAADSRLRPVFLNRRAAARYRALASIIPGRERFSWNLSFQFS